MKNSNTGGEGRTYPRITEKVSIDISVITYPPDKEPVQKGYLKDVSGGGIGFSASRQYARDTLLGLKIHLAGWQRHKKSYTRVIDDKVAVAPLTAISRVVWCKKNFDGNGFEVGVKFVDIYEDDYQAFLKHLKNLEAA